MNTQEESLGSTRSCQSYLNPILSWNQSADAVLHAIIFEGDQHTLVEVLDMDSEEQACICETEHFLPNEDVCTLQIHV
jgi:hypothetical protein